MTLAEIVERLGFEVRAGRELLGRPVGGGYCGDLLSDVIAHGRREDLWLTIQVHPNIVAVAALKELAAVVLVGGREPAGETVERAAKEGVVLLRTPLSAFAAAGRLSALGLRGE